MFNLEYREMSFVNRWAILRRVKEQTVGEHSFYVALYVGDLADLIGWHGDRGDLHRCALVHDMFEARSGDIPSPFKRQMALNGRYDSAERGYFEEQFPSQVRWLALLKLDPGIRALVGTADRLEGCMHLATESMLGNRYVGGPGDADSPSYDMFQGLEASYAALAEHSGLQCPADEVVGLLRDRVSASVTAAYTACPHILMRSSLA